MYSPAVCYRVCYLQLQASAAICLNQPRAIIALLKVLHFFLCLNQILIEMAHQRFRENIEGDKLDLSMSGLLEVPVKDIALIKKTTYLDLSNNQITSLPPSFGSLTHLVRLDLSNNMIRELPESFGKLTNLKVLDLYGNQLSHLPLSFCHLKALRWLDLKKNPLVPMLEGIAGPCGDNKQCEQCARDIVRTFTKAAIKVEEDRNRMLQKKLLEKEQLEQEYLMKKKELEGEGNKKVKKKNKKTKAEKQSHDTTEKTKTETSKESSEIISNDVRKGSDHCVEYLSPVHGRSLIGRCLGFILLMAFVAVSTITVLLLCCILLAVYDSNNFLQTAESLHSIPKSLTLFVLNAAKYVEYVAEHPTSHKMISLLADCYQTIITSFLNIYTTIWKDFPLVFKSNSSEVKTS